MIERHLMKVRARDDISAEEEAAVRGAVTEVRDYAPDAIMTPANKMMEICTILLSGVACRQKDLPDGRRQITELHVAGDFTDLHSFTLKYLDHEVAAISACQMAVVPHSRMRDITERFPRLARIYWFATNLDAAIHREWEVSLGRRSALERMAHLYCELHVRLGLVGLADAEGYDLPVTQAKLADALGLSDVHVNRTLMQLREQGLVEVRGGRVTLRDLPGLKAAAGFDPAYLYLRRGGR